MAKTVKPTPDGVTELVQRLKATEFQLSKLRKAQISTTLANTTTTVDGV